MRLRGPRRPIAARITAGLRLIAVILAVVRLVYMVREIQHHHGHHRPQAVGSIHSCPVRIAALVPVASRNSRTDVAADYAAVLATDSAEGPVTGSLWVTASGRPFRVPVHMRHALANDLGGTIDPIVFHLPQQARLEEAFVDRYDDGSTPRPCAIAGDWTGAMTPALHDDMLARIGTPARSNGIAAEPITDPETECKGRGASAQTIDAGEPLLPLEARRRNITGNVNVVLQLDSASRVRSMGIMASPSAILNPSALDATRASLFHTQISNCRPMAEKFVFVVSYGSP